MLKAKFLAIAAAATLLAASPLILSLTAGAEPFADIESLMRDYGDLKRNAEQASREVDSYLSESKAVRSFEEQDMEKLIVSMCGLDIERNDDDAERLAKDMTSRAVDIARRRWDDITRYGEKTNNYLLDTTKKLKDLDYNIRSVSETDANKSARSSLLEQVARSTDELMRKKSLIDDDLRALTNVKGGLMNGTNNPKIRARLEYGKRQHVEMQSRFYCDAKEIVLHNGTRPDCVLFVKDACRVYEFKPDFNNGQSVADEEAKRYIEGVQKYYRDRPDSKALELCKKDGNGTLEFRPIGQTYYACSSSRS